MLSVFGNSFDEIDLDGMNQVMNTHLVGKGEITTKFEKAFAAQTEIGFAAATNSCTNAFWLLFKSLNLSEGSEVLIPNIHFFGLKNILHLFKLKMVVTDVGSDIPNIRLQDIQKNITAKTRAVIFLEYGGYPVEEITKIRDYLRQIGRAEVILILDAANSLFTKKNGKYSAKNYDVALYSFDQNKVLVTGDGGMVVSENFDLIRDIKSLSYYGIQDSATTGFEKSQTGNLWWEINISKPSIKLCMNNLAASLGLSQMAKIDKFFERRSEIKKLYLALLNGLIDRQLVSVPAQDPSIANNLYLFWIKLKSQEVRNSLAKYLLNNKIYTTVKYQPLDPSAATPNAYDYYYHSLCLPFNQNLKDTDVDFVIRKIEEFLK